MAIVPLLLIRMKVMMAIRMRGMLLPKSVSAKTSLGLGQGTVVDIRTVMYEIKKLLKMKVSLRRKIHIIALPQGTFLNARWSEDQSATMPCKPSGSGRASPEVVIAGRVMLFDPPCPAYLTQCLPEMHSPAAATARQLPLRTPVGSRSWRYRAGPQMAIVSGVQLFWRGGVDNSRANNASQTSSR